MANPNKLTGSLQSKETSRPQRQAKPVRPGVTPTMSSENLLLLQRAMADPSSASPQDILTLQRLVGNRAVSSLIQTKPMDDPVEDQLEQQADQTAEVMVSRPQEASALKSQVLLRSVQPVVVQRVNGHNNPVPVAPTPLNSLSFAQLRLLPKAGFVVEQVSFHYRIGRFDPLMKYNVTLSHSGYAGTKSVAYHRHTENEDAFNAIHLKEHHGPRCLSWMLIKNDEIDSQVRAKAPDGLPPIRQR